MVTEPLSGRTSPTKLLISVVLPAPLGPKSPKNSPSRSVRSIPARASTSPKLFFSPDISIAFIFSKLDLTVTVRNEKSISFTVLNKQLLCSPTDKGFERTISYVIDIICHGNEISKPLGKHRIWFSNGGRSGTVFGTRRIPLRAVKTR